MPIDFFPERCKTASNDLEFGLCDDTPNSPAYIDESDRSKWIGIVKNPGEKKAEFYAIDNCVEIKRPNGEDESRCDGVLKESTNLIFVELKERGSSGWFKKGREQLTITIDIFKNNHEITNFSSIRAFVCNKLKPSSNSGRAANIQQFFDETGFILKDKQEITI